MHSFFQVFLIFMIYSMVGYIAEIISCSITCKKIVRNRGFLIGPYLPIYGVGAILISLTLEKYHGDPLALFIISAFYCTVLEYFTSLIMEKIFHLRWWDYSQKKLNLNGRVCFYNAVLFGIGGFCIVEYLNPLVTNLVSKIPPTVLYIISSILLIIFITDIIVTLKIMFGVKKNLGKINEKDATEQIKIEVKNYLSKYNYLTIRLIKSFPDMEKFNGVGYRTFTSMLDTVKSEITSHKKEK